MENTLKGLRSEIKRLENEQKRATIGSAEYIEVTEKIGRLKEYVKSQTGSVKDLENSWKSTVEKAAEYSNVLMGIQSAFQMIDLGVGKLKDLAKDAAALDDVYADVMKTTGLTHEEVERLNEAFKKMDTRTSREQLNQLAYEAGKLGLNSAEAVAQFVSASDKINIALGDVLGEGAMVTIGKLTNIFETSTTALAGKNLEEKMLAIGSAVNSLGQASTANEGYLVEFMKRLGGIAAQAGLSADQILGYASALDQNGQAVEMSATAFTKMIMQMVKKPEEFVKAAGMSLAEFQQMMDRDMNGAIQRVLEGMDAQGGFQQIVQMFNEMGLDGSRAAQAISSLAKHLDQVREAQALASDEIRTGSSVVNEFNTKNETMQAEAEKAKKKFQDIRIELGNELYPVLIKLQKSGTVLMKGVAGTIQLFKEAPALIAPVVAALIAWNRYRILNVVTSGKLTEALKKLVGISKMEAVTSALQERNEKKLTAAKEAARLKSLQSMLATEKETLARQSASKQTMIQELATKTKNRVYALEVQVTEQATRAEQAHAAATRASRAAMMSVPWGMILAAVTAIIAGVTKLVKKANEVKSAAKEIAHAGAEAESKVRILQDRLDDSRKGTDDYRKALVELKEMYPDIVKQFLDEEGALIDVKKALEAVSKASKQAAMDQIYNQKASEYYTDEAQKMQEAMAVARKLTQTNSLVFWKEGTTDAMKAEAWRRYTEWVRKAQSGTVSWDDAIKGAQKDLGDMGYVLTSTFGTGSNDMIYQMRKMKKASEEAQGKIQELDETLKSLYGYSTSQPVNQDPYKLAGKSVKELNDLLAETKKYKDAVLSDQQDPFGTQKAMAAARKIEAIEKELERRRSEKKTNEPVVADNDSPFDDKELKKWERVKDRAEKLIADFGVKAESGLKRVQEEVRARRDAMLKDIDEAVGATKAQKEALKAQVADAAAALERSKVAEYIKKQTAELEKMKRSLKGDSENKYLTKIEEAERNLLEQTKAIDEAVMKAEADAQRLETEEIAALEKRLAVATDEAIVASLQKEIKERQSNLKTISDTTAAYQRLKREFANQVYNGIVEREQPKARPLSRDESQWSQKTQEAVGEMKGKGYEWLFDKEAFDQYGRALEQISEKYEKQKKDFKERAEAEAEILQRLNEQRRAAFDAASEENDFNEERINDLDRQIAEHEDNAAAIQHEQQELERLNKEAQDAAKEDAFGKTIDRWIIGIDKFASEAMEVWDNLNKLMENIAQSRIQELEAEKEDATELLEEQLEQGIISQETYNEEKDRLDKEYKQKEDELNEEVWRRNKAYSISEATMSAALAILRVWSDAGNGTTVMRAAQTALVAANTAMQIAAIINEPKPYAKGGYVEKRTVYQAGEAGPEWVASNGLLSDPTTAPIIEQLEQYQRGNRRALADIPIARLDMPTASAAAAEIGRRQVVVRDIAAPAWQNQPTPSPYDDSRMVALLTDLSKYMKDPKNRQAVISRRTMEDFEGNENFLRNRARL